MNTYRIRIHENYFLHIQWEQYIQKQNFVTPDRALFFGLLMQPAWPFVLDQFVLEIVLFGHVR